MGQERTQPFCSSGSYVFAALFVCSSHSLQTTDSSSHPQLSVTFIIFSDVIALRSHFISLSHNQHTYLLVCRLLSKSSIYPSFHCLSPFLPHFLSCSRQCFFPPLPSLCIYVCVRVCVCPPQTSTLHNYFSACTCNSSNDLNTR